MVSLLQLDIWSVKAKQKIKMAGKKFNFLISLRSTFLVIFCTDHQHEGKNDSVSDFSEMEFNVNL